MPQQSPSRHQDQYLVRMPGGMRDRIKAAAEASNRSMNAEIVARLEASFSEPVSQSEMAILIHDLKETLERVHAAEAAINQRSGLDSPQAKRSL